jgi:hypothetical protein
MRRRRRLPGRCSSGIVFGVYGHVLYLAQLEAGFHVITIPPQCKR